jgi:hypothetical protein
VLTRADAGIAENPVQRSWETKARKTPSVKDRTGMRCVRWASWEGIVRAAKMAQECRTNRKPAVRVPAALALGSRVTTTPPPNGKEALKR